MQKPLPRRGSAAGHQLAASHGSREVARPPAAAGSREGCCESNERASSPAIQVANEAGERKASAPWRCCRASPQNCGRRTRRLCASSWGSRGVSRLAASAQRRSRQRWYQFEADRPWRCCQFKLASTGTCRRPPCICSLSLATPRRSCTRRAKATARPPHCRHQIA